MGRMRGLRRPRTWAAWTAVGLCYGLALGNPLGWMTLLVLPAIPATLMLLWCFGVGRETWGLVVGLSALPAVTFLRLPHECPPVVAWPALGAAALLLAGGLALYVAPRPTRR